MPAFSRRGRQDVRQIDEPRGARQDSNLDHRFEAALSVRDASCRPRRICGPASRYWNCGYAFRCRQRRAPMPARPRSVSEAGSGTALGVAAGPSSRVCTTTKSPPNRRKRMSAVLREKPRKAPWFVPPGVAGEGRPRRGSPRAAHRGHRCRAALRVGWRAARAGRQRSTDLSHGGSWRR